MPDVTITQSTVKDHQRCKRKWWLRHHRRITKQRYGSAMNVGNLVHDALAEWYAGRLQEGPLERIRERAEAEIELFPDYAADILKDAELALIMVEGYLEWLEETGADYELEMVEPEREVEIALAPERTDLHPSFGRVLLRGKIDGKSRRRDGWTAFLEHKTVQNFVDLPAIARMDPQLLTYELLDYLGHLEKQEREAQDSLAELEKLPPIEDRGRPLVGGYILNMLRKVKRTGRAKPPFYERLEGDHNIHQLRNHWRHVVAEAREMQQRAARLDAGEDHHTAAPPAVRATCRWDCEFFEVCPLFDDGSDVESVLALEFEPHDPLARYTDLGASESERSQ